MRLKLVHNNKLVREGYFLNLSDACDWLTRYVGTYIDDDLIKFGEKYEYNIHGDTIMVKKHWTEMFKLGVGKNQKSPQQYIEDPNQYISDKLSKERKYRENVLNDLNKISEIVTNTLDKIDTKEINGKQLIYSISRDTWYKYQFNLSWDDEPPFGNINFLVGSLAAVRYNHSLFSHVHSNLLEKTRDVQEAILHIIIEEILDQIYKAR